MKCRYLLSITFFTIINLLAACVRQSEISESDLLKYVMDEDHGLIQKDVNQTNSFECIYWPSELIIRREIHNSGLIDSDSASNVIKRRLKNVTYIMLKKRVEQSKGQFTTFGEVNLSVDGENLSLMDQFTLPNNDGRSFAVLYAFESKLRLLTGDLNISIDDGLRQTKFKFNNNDVKKVLGFKIIN